jgi:DNA replication initiation complex subunit (GINS family)
MMPPDFRLWNRANLIKLAEEMYAELHELRKDLKDAMKAYRDLNKTKGNKDEKINHCDECGK